MELLDLGCVTTTSFLGWGFIGVFSASVSAVVLRALGMSACVCQTSLLKLWRITVSCVEVGIDSR